MHINPPLSAVGDFDYNHITVYTFASDTIFQMLAKKHRTQMLAGAVDMFNVGVASESYDAVSSDKLFEYEGLSLVVATGWHALYCYFAH